MLHKKRRIAIWIVLFAILLTGIFIVNKVEFWYLLCLIRSRSEYPTRLWDNVGHLGARIAVLAEMNPDFVNDVWNIVMNEKEDIAFRFNLANDVWPLFSDDQKYKMLISFLDSGNWFLVGTACYMDYEGFWERLDQNGKAT